MNKNRIKKDNQIFGWISAGVLTLYTVSLLVPLLWAILNSLKGRLDFRDDPFGWPEKFLWSNYVDVFRLMSLTVEDGLATRTVGVAEMFLYTIIYAAGSTLVSMVVHCTAAYISAKYSRYRIARLMYTIVIVAMILPIVGSLASELQMARALKLYDNFLGIFVMKGHFLGMNFLLYYASFKSISWEYAEAAQMDGASALRIYLVIMIPLARTTITALMLLDFITYWNDYTSPMIYLPSYPTIAYGLYRFQFSTDNAASSVTMQLAACTIVVVPIFIIYMIFRKQLMGNIAIGGIKG